MNQAIYSFVDRINNEKVDSVQFELFDNPGCLAWQYAVLLNNKSRTCVRAAPGAYLSSRPRNLETQYNELLAVLDQLAQDDFKYQGSVPAGFDQADQNFMNRIHRFFTESCRVLWDVSYTDFDKQFTINERLQKLNSLIHQLENYLTTDTKIKYAGIINNNEIRVINSCNEIGFDLVPFRKYHSYESADLIMDPYILGKSLLESFLCEDNAAHWDTSGHTSTNGGACIMLSDHRTHIYHSRDFDQWLSQQGLNKHSRYADFPLGNFVSGHKEKMQALTNHLHKFSCTVEIKLS